MKNILSFLGLLALILVTVYFLNGNGSDLLSNQATDMAKDVAMEKVEEVKNDAMEKGQEVIDREVNKLVDKKDQVIDETIDNLANNVKEELKTKTGTNSADAVITDLANTAKENITDTKTDTNENENNDSAAVNTGVGIYIENGTPESIGASVSENVVVVFSAGWCPTCQVLKRDINANLDKIPGDLTIVSLDYDKYKSSELGKNLKVVSQHTMHLVDKEGNSLKQLKRHISLDELLVDVSESN